jgi:hypothetical protein
MKFYITATLKRKISIEKLMELATKKAKDQNPESCKEISFKEIESNYIEVTSDKDPQYWLTLHITDNGYTITSCYWGYPPTVILGHRLLSDLVTKYGGDIFDWDLRRTYYYSLKTKKWSKPEEFDESLLR